MKKKSKWSIDRNGNIEGEGRFFNVADIKCIYFVEEKETCSLYITVPYAQIQLGYPISGKENVSRIRDWLKKIRIEYQENCKKHTELHHKQSKELLDEQKKFLKTAAKNCKNSK